MNTLPPQPPAPPLTWLDGTSPETVASLPPGVRLALFSPVREHMTLADRKAAALLAGSGLVLSVLHFNHAVAIRCARSSAG